MSANGDGRAGGRPDAPGSRTAGTRPGRRALFSEPSVTEGMDPGPRDLPEGRRALFSTGQPEPAAHRGGVVVHCRTCLTATPLSMTAVARALIPSLWLPTRPWPRLMRCPACHRVSWCRIDWPGPF